MKTGSDPVDKIICKYKFHPSILLIQSKLEIFLFLTVSNLTWNCNLKFKILITIPPKILKVSCNTLAEILQNLFNEYLLTGNFADNLKLVDITPGFKWKDPFNKETYRPVKVLPSISKNLRNLCKNK